LTNAGEDTIYLDREKKIAVNKEVYTDDTLAKLNLLKSELEEVRAIEVGNIFPLGTRFSEVLNLRAKDASGNEQPVIMGSYGIGLGRLLGTIVEVLSDEKGIVWPKNVAPFRYHLIDLSGGDASVKAHGEALYEKLKKSTIEVLYDDRDLRPGEKFADADLLGIPERLVISAKTIAAGKVEVMDRTTGQTQLIDEHEIIARGRDGSGYVSGT
jgi:prolyl-tRNA synthetase